MKAYLLFNEIKSSIILFITFEILIFSLLVVGFIIFPININISNEYIKNILFITSDLNNPNEYYAFIMEYIIILSAIFATILATKTIVHDKISGYDEYLFSLPTTRSKIFFNKVIAIAFETILFNLIFYILSFVLNIVFDFNINKILLFKMNLSLTLSTLTFASIGILVGSFIKPKFIYIKSLSFTILLLLIAIPERLFNITILRYINPFSYFKLYELISNGYRLSFIIASGCIMIFSLSISKTIYDEYDVLKGNY